MTDSYSDCTKAFKALSDRTRLEIILLIKDEDQCAGKLLEHFCFSQPTLSYHMKTLIGAGLVTARKEGLRVHYSLNREHLDYVIRILSAVTKGGPAEKNFTQTHRNVSLQTLPHRKE